MAMLETKAVYWYSEVSPVFPHYTFVGEQLVALLVFSPERKITLIKI